jgi:NAD(P)-dependent dehydrogenase (short-subunit alcohol dehydrogenase family)
MPSVLVTGAGRGIGLAITEHMSNRTARRAVGVPRDRRHRIK